MCAAPSAEMTQLIGFLEEKMVFGMPFDALSSSICALVVRTPCVLPHDAPMEPCSWKSTTLSCAPRAGRAGSFGGVSAPSAGSWMGGSSQRAGR